MTLKGAIFTRSGYTQKGWSVNASGTTKDYGLNGTYSVNEGKTLYPYWEKDPEPEPVTYRVYYKPGSLGREPQQSVSFAAGESVTLKGAVFTADGYTQKGWSRTDGGAKAYELGATVKPGSDLTLYPYWTANPKVNPFGFPTQAQLKGTIFASWQKPFYLVAAGSTGTDYAPLANFAQGSAPLIRFLVCNYGSGTAVFEKAVLLLRDSSGGEVASCNLNSGESIAASGAVNYDAPWDAVLAKLPAGNYSMTLTLNPAGGQPGSGWTNVATYSFAVTAAPPPVQTYTVRFHRNDGSGETKTKTYTAGASVTLPWINSGLGWETPKGWTIVGWARSASATTAEYANGATVPALGTAGQTVDLYVVWKKPPPVQTYTVRFHRNDGSGETKTKTYTAGASVTLPWINSGLGWETPKGWTIDGWARSASATAAEYANGATVPALGMVGQTVDLYVVWKKPPAKTYTVRFHTAYGTDVTADQSFTVGVAQQLYWKDSQLKWTRAGYTFLGWAKDTSSGLVKYANGESVKDVAAEGKVLNLYAVWANASAYRIVYHRNTSSSDAVTATQRAWRGNALNLVWKDSQLGWSNPSGKTFDGWSIYPNAAAGYYKNGQSVKDLAAGGKTIDLYAVWKSPSASYTVRFNKNDGSGATETRTYSAGASLTLPWINSGLGWETPKDWTIVGWAKSASATAAEYANGATVPALGTAGQTVDLYVVWRKPALPDFGFARSPDWPASVYLASEQWSTSAKSTFGAGEPCYLCFGYANFGAADAARAESYVVKVDGVQVDALTAGEAGLVVGKGRAVSRLLPISGLSAGQHTVTVVLNPSKAIQESDYDNNTAGVTFTVTGGQGGSVVSVTAPAAGGTVSTPTITLAQKGSYTFRAVNLPSWITRVSVSAKDAQSTLAMSGNPLTFTLLAGATAQVSFALTANTTGATRTYTYTVTGPESYSIVVTQPPSSAKSASASVGGTPVATAAGGGLAASRWEPGYYRGEFADGSGTFDLIVADDGAAFFRAETEDGAWTAECEAEVVGETLLLSFEDGDRFVLSRNDGLVIVE